MSTDSKNIKNYSAEDIRRYWNNEMSATEMHALELAAMDDPFLADALEGYSKLQKDPADDLAVLTKRLARRSSVAKVIPIKKSNRWLQVAAAIILLAGLGLLTFILMPDKKSEMTIAQVQKDSVSPPASITTTEKSANEKETLDSHISSLAESNKNKDNLVVERSRAKPGPVDIQQEQAKIDSSPVAIASVANPNDDYKSAAPVALQKAPEKNITRGDVAAGKAAVSKEEANHDAYEKVALNNFSGKVVDAQNRAVANATVVMNNGRQGTMTDKEGMFQFNSRDTVAEVSISSVGFQDRNVTLNSTRNGVSIALEREDEKFNEVVIANPKMKQSRKIGEGNLKVFVMDAEPVIGWDKYSEYIDNNKIAPVNEPVLKGEVVLSFKVNQKGELSSFDVEKSLNKYYDNEAIRLIKQGPAWRVNKGKKAKVKLIVRF